MFEIKCLRSSRFCVTLEKYDTHMTVSGSNIFHGVTVAYLLPGERIAFGQVKNSILGTTLSGNWIFSKDDSESISSVCRSHILVSSKETLSVIENFSNQSVVFGDFDELIASIKLLEEDLRNAWVGYLEENPKKAKTLVPPKWANWLSDLTLDDPIQSLTKSGKSAHPDSTPEDMQSLIALARLVRYALDNWRELEENRFTRKFLHTSKEEQQLWPPNWNLSHRGQK